jgi:putative thioredoxin
MINKIDVIDKDFQKQVIEQSKKLPILVDFYGTWCGPCRILGPILEKLAEKYNGKFILAKINVDESPKISQEYEIRSIPAVKLFKNGKIVSEFIGAMPEAEIKKFLDRNL